MTVADSPDFTERLKALGAVFDANLTAVKVVVYFEALRDLPFEVVVQAMNHAVKTCKFFPKPAELRSLAVGDDEDVAETAWVSLRAAMKHAGSYASLAVGDAALAETIVSVFGGWPQACASDLSPEMWASKRKEFGRVYRVMRQRGMVGTRFLPGICEQQNAGRPDWAQYVPVHRLEAHGIERLTLAEAEDARTLTAAASHGFTRLGAGSEVVPLVQPVERDDTA